MTNIEEEKHDAVNIESAEQTRQENRESDPLARLEALRTTVLGATKDRAVKDSAEDKSRIQSGVESVKGTQADAAAIAHEVEPLEAAREGVLRQTEQSVGEIHLEGEVNN